VNNADHIVVERRLDCPVRAIILPNESIMKERRYYIDWLRVIAMLAVFLYHCARFFDTEGWILKNTAQSSTVDGIRGVLLWPWLMEIFFLLSGFAAWHALRTRSGKKFLLERVKRLLFPIFVLGLFLLNPPQFYFYIATNHRFQGTFWESLSIYFSHWSFHLESAEGLLPAPPAMHLWFLQYLFLISLMALPLLLFFRSRTGRRGIEKVARWCDHPSGIFLFFIPIALILIFLPHVGEGKHTWADFLWYATFFLTGTLLAADSRFIDSTTRYEMLSGWVCLGLFGLFLVLGALFPKVFINQTERWTSWFAVIFLLSLGAKYFNCNNKVLAYFNEAVLPFYLLHHTIIVCVGWFVIPLNMGILPKFLIIAVVSFPLMLLLYEFLVRRFNVVRFFFGMRSKKASGIRP
jgi:glucans biosynthesis protein C